MMMDRVEGNRRPGQYLFTFVRGGIDAMVGPRVHIKAGPGTRQQKGSQVYEKTANTEGTVQTQYEG